MLALAKSVATISPVVGSFKSGTSRRAVEIFARDFALVHHQWLPLLSIARLVWNVLR